jgi:hypothetical protein
MIARRDSHNVVWPGGLFGRRRIRISAYRSPRDRHYWCVAGDGELILSHIHNTGTVGIIEKIRSTVGDRPVYLSIDVRQIQRRC